MNRCFCWSYISTFCFNLQQSLALQPRPTILVVHPAPDLCSPTSGPLYGRADNPLQSHDHATDDVSWRQWVTAVWTLNVCRAAASLTMTWRIHYRLECQLLVVSLQLFSLQHCARECTSITTTYFLWLYFFFPNTFPSDKKNRDTCFQAGKDSSTQNTSNRY